MDRTLTDAWVKVPDKEGHQWARRMLKEEGMMVGGSCGSAVWGAVQYIKENKIGKGKRCVVLLPDNVRNYMTKHLNNDWMYEQGWLTEEECAKAAVSDLIPNTDWGQERTVSELRLKEAVFLSADETISEVWKKMLTQGFAQYPVKEADGTISGVVTKIEVMNKLVKRRVSGSDPVRGIV